MGITPDYLQEEAEKGKRKNFDRFMKRVPDVEPDVHDSL